MEAKDKPFLESRLRTDLQGNRVFQLKYKYYYADDINLLVDRLAIVWPRQPPKSFSENQRQRHFQSENARLCRLSDDDVSYEAYLHKHEFELWRYFSFLQIEARQQVTFPEKRFVRGTKFSFDKQETKVTVDDRTPPASTLVSFERPPRDKKRKKQQQGQQGKSHFVVGDVIDMNEHRVKVEWDIPDGIDEVLDPEVRVPANQDLQSRCDMLVQGGEETVRINNNEIPFEPLTVTIEDNHRERQVSKDAKRAPIPEAIQSTSRADPRQEEEEDQPILDPEDHEVIDISDAESQLSEPKQQSKRTKIVWTLEDRKKFYEKRDEKSDKPKRRDADAEMESLPSTAPSPSESSSSSDKTKTTVVDAQKHRDGPQKVQPKFHPRTLDDYDVKRYNPPSDKKMGMSSLNIPKTRPNHRCFLEVFNDAQIRDISYEEETIIRRIPDAIADDYIIRTLPSNPLIETTRTFNEKPANARTVVLKKMSDWPAIDDDLKAAGFYDNIKNWGMMYCYVFTPDKQQLYARRLCGEARGRFPEVFVLSDVKNNVLIIPTLATDFDKDEGELIIQGCDIPKKIRKFIADNPFIFMVTWNMDAHYGDLQQGMRERLNLLNIEAPNVVDIKNFVPIFRPQWTKEADDLDLLIDQFVLRRSVHYNIDRVIKFRDDEDKFIDATTDFISRHMCQLHDAVFQTVAKSMSDLKFRPGVPIAPYIRQILWFCSNMPTLHTLAIDNKDFEKYLRPFVFWGRSSAPGEHAANMRLFRFNQAKRVPPWHGLFPESLPLYASSVTSSDLWSRHPDWHWKTAQALAHFLTIDPYKFKINADMVPDEFHHLTHHYYKRGVDRDSQEYFAKKNLLCEPEFCCICSRCGGHDHVEETCKKSRIECGYFLCRSPRNHATKVCRTLHSQCHKCGWLGHHHSHHERFDLVTLQTIFRLFAPFGFKTVLPFQRHKDYLVKNIDVQEHFGHYSLAPAHGCKLMEKFL